MSADAEKVGSRSDGESPCWDTVSACRFGWTEYDSYRYCHEHGEFAAFYGDTPNQCPQALAQLSALRQAARRPARELAAHRTRATFGLVCSTCDDGGCPDCTDPT